MSVDLDMTGPIDDQSIGAYLSAFADGELDAAQNLAVLKYISAHPEALQALEIEQRLRDAALRAIRSAAPAAPQTLRERIESLEVGRPATAPLRGPLTFAKRAAAFAAAAVILLALGITAGRSIGPRGLPIATGPAALNSGTANTGSSAPIVPVTVVDAVTKVHVDCSRFDAALHSGGYPQELAGVADVVKQDLSSDQPYPDLAGVGYKFIGAGPCSHPLANTVHLLYQSTHGHVRDTLSVFVQPYTGQYDLQPGKAYLLTPRNAAHPMLVWRSKLAVYFVTGDDWGEVKSAAAVMPDQI